MTKVVDAVYENGVFKPMKKVKLTEHGHFKLTISPIEPIELIEEDEEAIKRLVEKQKKALKELIGIGDSGLGDASKNHDKYLYIKDW